jgi:hypothetical protein
LIILLTSAVQNSCLNFGPRGYAQPPDVMTVEKWVKED